MPTIFELGMAERDPWASGTGSEPPCTEVGGEVNDPRPRCRHFATCYREAGLFALLCARACACTLLRGGRHCFSLSKVPEVFSICLYLLGARFQSASHRAFSKQPRPPAGANFLEVVFTSPKLLRTVAGILFSNAQ
jgi:hypothetical protein